MADPNNIQVPINSVISSGSTPVPVIPANAKGGWITNPPGASESLFINPLLPGGVVAGGNNGTDFEILPGVTWLIVPFQNSITYANAVTSGHAFSAIYWV